MTVQLQEKNNATVITQNETDEFITQNETDELPKEDLAYPKPLIQCYEPIRKLGKGSQGQVWLATRKSDNEQVAIKQLHIHSVKTWKQYELFQREAKILSKLNMPGVVPFYEYIEDFGAYPPYVCIVQKYIHGETLAEMLRAKHRFKTEDVYDIMAQTLFVLRQLHENNPQVIHRDIKPSNIMLTPKENGRYAVTLLDFGAVANPQVQNGGSTVAGTFGYMPPEQLMGQAVPGSDIYALAAVGVQMLSGVAPADIDVCDFRLVIEPHLTHIPKDVVQTFNHMLAPALSERLSDHNALIAYFQGLAGQRKTSFLSVLKTRALPKLEDVKSICQPGNYELWQAFEPDKTIFEAKQFINAHKKNNQKIRNIKFKLKIAFTLVIIAILFAALTAILDIFVAAITTIGCLAISGCYFILDYHKYERLNVMLFELEKPDNNQMNSIENWKPVTELMEKCQKVVGKITYIEYIETTSDSISELDDQTNTLFAVKGIPRFKIEYKFKLNYEGMIINFKGNLITQVPPENHYKIGDPITLLANIQQNSTKDAILKVIPYPFPYGEITELNQIQFKVKFNQSILLCDDRTKAVEKALMLAKVYETEKKFQMAEECYMQALCLGNDDVIIKIAAYYHYVKRACDDAAKWYENAHKHGCNEAYENLAELYKQFDRINEAANIYKILYNKGNIKAGYLLAEMYELRGLYEKAEEALQIMFNNKEYLAGIKIGDLYNNRNDMHNAKKWYEKAYQAAGPEFGFKIAKEFHEKSLNDTKYIATAEMWYNRLYNDGRKNVAIMLANFYRVHDRPTDAKHWYEIAYQEGNQGAIPEIVNLCLAKNNVNEAAKWLLILVKNFPEKCRKYYNWMRDLANKYESVGKLNEAETFYSAIGEYEPSELLHIVDMYLKCGKNTAAANAYEKYINQIGFDFNLAMEISEKLIRDEQIELGVKWCQKCVDNCIDQKKNMDLKKVIKIAEICRDYKMLDKTKELYSRIFLMANLKTPDILAEKYTHNKNVNELVDICEQRFAEGYIIVCKLIAAILKHEKWDRKFIIVWEDMNIVRDRGTKPYVKLSEHWIKYGDRQKAMKWAEIAHKKGDKNIANKMLDLCMSDAYINDKEIMRWTKISTNLDDSECAIKIAGLYKQKNKREKTVYWLKKAHEYGSNVAADKLIKIFALEMNNEHETLKWYKIKNQIDGDQIAKTYLEIRREIAAMI